MGLAGLCLHNVVQLAMEELMPRKRPLDIRLAEHEAKLEDLKLEKAINEMKAKRARRKPVRRGRK